MPGAPHHLISSRIKMLPLSEDRYLDKSNLYYDKNARFLPLPRRRGGEDLLPGAIAVERWNQCTAERHGIGSVGNKSTKYSAISFP